MIDQGDHWRVNSRETLAAFIEFAERSYQDHGFVTFKWEFGDQRTRQQNKAMWVYLSRIAKEMDDRGLDMKQVLKQEVAIRPTKQLVKEYMWNPVQKLVTGETSSTRLKRQQIDEVQETLARFLSEKFDITVAFPKKE